MSQRLGGLVLTTMARLLHDRRGASAILVAVALPVLIGFGTLGAETGLWYAIKRQNQSAADAAAISVAYEVIAGKIDLAADLTPAASEAAARNAYSGTPPLVVYPYADSIVNDGAAVTLQQTQPGMLASLFLSSVMIATKAVTVIKVLDNPCILALGTNGTDVEVGASSALDVPNCSVAANSTSSNSIDIQSNTGSITAATLVTRGEISLSGIPIDPIAPPPEFAVTSRPLIGTPNIADPYTGTLTHAFLTNANNIPAARVERHFWNETTTISPALYKKGISFGANAFITLLPGIYYVTNGDFSVARGATIIGSGVTIILSTTQAAGGIIGNLKISAGATVTLEAPNSGTFSGLLFIQNPLATSSGIFASDNTIDGGLGMNLTGLLYFPSTTVTFEGNPNATCTVLIAKQVVIDGDSNFNTSECKVAGLAILPTVRTVALAE